MRNHVFALAFALTCGAAFGSAPAAAQDIYAHAGYGPAYHGGVAFTYPSAGYYPQPTYAAPAASSCCCQTMRRGFFTSGSFGCPTVAAYPQYAYPQYTYTQYPAYQPYPAVAYPQAPVYPQPYPVTYAPPAYAPGVGVGVGIGPVGIGIGADVRHRYVTHRHTHRRVCWRDDRGRRHCR